MGQCVRVLQTLIEGLHTSHLELLELWGNPTQHYHHSATEAPLQPASDDPTGSGNHPKTAHREVHNSGGRAWCGCHTCLPARTSSVTERIRNVAHDRFWNETFWSNL